MHVFHKSPSCAAPQMCAKKVVETVDGRETVRYEDCMGLQRSAADGFWGDEPQEQFTKRLAGGRVVKSVCWVAE